MNTDVQLEVDKNEWQLFASPAVRTELQCKYSVCVAFDGTGAACHRANTEYCLGLIDDLYNNFRRLLHLCFGQSLSKTVGNLNVAHEERIWCCFILIYITNNRGVFKPQLGKTIYAKCSSLEYDQGLNALLTYNTGMTSLWHATVLMYHFHFENSNFKTSVHERAITE